jgi:hypothetical protein
MHEFGQACREGFAAALQDAKTTILMLSPDSIRGYFRFLPPGGSAGAGWGKRMNQFAR